MSTLFTYLSSLRIAALIRTAKSRVCYAAPGIQLAPAEAIAEVSKRISPDKLTVSLDFNESTLRMGYGSLEAVKLLTSNGVELKNSPGLRSAFLIVDDKGWVFTPTALLLEPEPQSDETPNALALTQQQISEVMLRVSPVAREEAIAAAITPEAKAAVASTVMEIGVVKVDNPQLSQVSKAIEQAPPVTFDLARQVRVFQPYLQYVEIELTGAKIQSHRSQIPPNIQQLGTGKDLEGKLRTTFQLIGKSNELTSEKLDKELDEIRKNFTRTIGKQERVILKSARPTFDSRIKDFEAKLETHKAVVKIDLEKELKKSREEVVEYYLPLARANPPDALIGQSLFSNPDDAEIRAWLNRELGWTFPTADSLIKEMKFDVRFKDVTFETLNRPDFINSLKAAYPDTPWEKAYKEFQAMAEREKSGEKPNP